jgi:hypothetical protein
MIDDWGLMIGDFLKNMYLIQNLSFNRQSTINNRK